MKCRQRWLCVGITFLLTVTCATAQSPEQVRQVKSRLEQMSPKEIEQALKQLGLTLDEATKQAAALGISLQDYLSKSTTVSATAEQLERLLIDPRLNWQWAMRARLEADSAKKVEKEEPKLKLLEVRGFKGRHGIDTTIQPYGYEVFEYPSTTFLPSLSVATPPSYVLGPGDEIVISVWGETQLMHRVEVNREGNVVIPEVGPVTAMGQTVRDFRDRLQRRMSAVYSSLSGSPGRTRSSLDVSLGKLKTIQVFVLGEVNKPGGYALTSMSTTLHALYMAGGPTVDGTLRNVQILRRGEPAAEVDIYSFVLLGDRTKDQSLQDGDIVFVKPVTRRAAVVGHVVRPAIYELKEGETLGSLIAMAGGPRFDAHIERLHVERIVPFDRRNEYGRDILDFDVHSESLEQLLANSTVVENGDIVTIHEILHLFQNRVVIVGNVNKPGPFEFHPGMRVADLIMAADSLRLATFDEWATLYRTLPNLRTEVIGFNPRMALRGDPHENILLQNEDSVVVYSDEQFHPRHNVSVFGAVRKPGNYPRHDSMTVADLVVMAGGLVDGATTTGWELSRLDTGDIKTYTRVITVNGDDLYWRHDGAKGIKLEDFDVLTVPLDPRFSMHKYVRLTGYVMYPGTYTIQYEGERIGDLFKRAGGLRPGAYLEGSRLIRRFNSAGLVPLDFRKALEEQGSRDNVVLYDGDSINVAFTEDVIYVSGEVYVPSPVLYEEGAGLSYYIEQAGG
ncbi:MAG: SLBB domain-containing protein, partial [Bacteroidetes bacterium]|nr:SLBB domain-containing protein [Bacteroidota bacterium]